MRIECQRSPAHEAQTETGPLIVPAMIQWLVFCEDHDLTRYCPIATRQGTIDHLSNTPDHCISFLQTLIDSMDMGCDHRPPTPLALFRSLMRVPRP